MTVTADRAHYIKLGRGGQWEAECLREGTLRFGYGDTPHELCIAHDWPAVKDFWTKLRGNAGTVNGGAKTGHWAAQKSATLAM